MTDIDAGNKEGCGQGRDLLLLCTVFEGLGQVCPRSGYVALHWKRWNLEECLGQAEERMGFGCMLRQRPSLGNA